MKKSRIIFAAGATILAVAGFMTTKANKKFNGVISGYLKGMSAVSTIPSTFQLTNSVNTNHTVVLATASGTRITTLLTKIGGAPVYKF
jgi:hypothetical protein